MQKQISINIFCSIFFTRTCAYRDCKFLLFQLWKFHQLWGKYFSIFTLGPGMITDIIKGLSKFPEGSFHIYQVKTAKTEINIKAKIIYFLLNKRCSGHVCISVLQFYFLDLNCAVLYESMLVFSWDQETLKCTLSPYRWQQSLKKLF